MIYLLALILLQGIIFGQETPQPVAPLPVQNDSAETLPLTKESAETLIKQEKAPLPELGILKLKYFSNEITIEELYRLASFYLTEQQYQQAIEIYGQYIELAQHQQNNIPQERIATAYYNRALALFALKLYQSAIPMFNNAYFYNQKLNDALRMIGTIYFLQKNKEKSLEVWTQYLTETPDSSPQKPAIQQAVDLLSDPAFVFEKEQEKTKALPPNQQTWPFLNPDTIPNPDAKYQKKRVV